MGVLWGSAVPPTKLENGSSTSMEIGSTKVPITSWKAPLPTIPCILYISSLCSLFRGEGCTENQNRLPFKRSTFLWPLPSFESRQILLQSAKSCIYTQLEDRKGRWSIWSNVWTKQYCMDVIEMIGYLLVPKYNLRSKVESCNSSHSLSHTISMKGSVNGKLRERDLRMCRNYLSLLAMVISHRCHQWNAWSLVTDRSSLLTNEQNMSYIVCDIMRQC